MAFIHNNLLHYQQAETAGIGSLATLYKTALYMIFSMLYCGLAFSNGDDCIPPEMPEPIFGLHPLRFDWKEVAFRPELDEIPPLNLTVPTPYGPIHMTHDAESGYHLLLPAGIIVYDESPELIVVTLQEDPTLNQEALSTEDWELLNTLGWAERVGENQAILVSVARQRLYLIQHGEILWQVPIATSKLGTGQVANSMQTPLGWHKVSEKFGDGAAWGQVFRSRAATSKIWDGQEKIEEGLVLTRILWLEGLEDGLNKGKNDAGEPVDSKQRYIYIHGTNKEHCIGTPISDGCVNMYNDDVIRLFDATPVETPVLVIEE